jgi:hypothetical protein
MANPEEGRKADMALKFSDPIFLDDGPHEEVTEDGKWRFPCPTCQGGLLSATPRKSLTCRVEGCVDAWVTVDPLPLLESCKPEDHEWVLELEAGMVSVRCTNEHSPIEQQQMLRDENGHFDFAKTPACVFIPDEGRDFLSGEIPVMVTPRTEQYGGWDGPVEYDFYIDVEPVKEQENAPEE